MMRSIEELVKGTKQLPHPSIGKDITIEGELFRNMHISPLPRIDGISRKRWIVYTMLLYDPWARLNMIRYHISLALVYVF